MNKSNKKVTVSSQFYPLIIFIVILAGTFGFYRTAQDKIPESSSASYDSMTDIPWNLVLVNYDHPIPENYLTETAELPNGIQVDARIYPYLTEMLDDMQSVGIYAVVGEGFRTADEQQAMMDEKINAYIAEGFSRKRSESLAAESVARVGYSEHQLGLAADINADKLHTENDEVYSWLAENAYKYGFILRYPPEKEDITGITYEPWHYRYVGSEAAEEIHNRRICLEEYY